MPALDKLHSPLTADVFYGRPVTGDILGFAVSIIPGNHLSRHGAVEDQRKIFVIYA